MATPLINQIDLAESVRRHRLVPATEATSSPAQRLDDMKRIQEAVAAGPFDQLSKAPVPSAHMFVDSSLVARVQALQVALAKASTDIVDRWFSDEAAKFTQRLPLEAHEEELLKWIATSGFVPPYAGRQGLWRADLLFEQSARGPKPVICEVNARFPYNAWLLVSSLSKTLHDALGLDAANLHTTNKYSANEADILRLFDQTKPLHVLMGESWKGLDIHLVMQLYRDKTGQEAKIVNPADIRLIPDPTSPTGYHLSYSPPSNDGNDNAQASERIWQLSLEINQPELRPLDALILREVSRICVNDLRSILLVNDQRFMAIIREELDSMVRRSVISAAEAQMLDEGIVPTYLPSGNAWPAVVSSTPKDSWILKNTRGGEGKGHTFGHSVSEDEWAKLLKEAANTDVQHLEATYALQKRVVQVDFDVRTMETDKFDKLHVVGSFNSLHGRYYGFSGMRVARDFVLSLGPGGGLAMVAFTNAETSLET